MLCASLTLSVLLLPGAQDAPHSNSPDGSPDGSPRGAVLRLEHGAPDPRDPRADGWRSEAVAEDIGAQLKPLKKLLEHGAPGDWPAEWTQAHLSPALQDARVSELTPEDLIPVRQSPSIRSLRLGALPEGTPPTGSLRALVERLRGPMQGDLHAKIKVTSIRLPGTTEEAGLRDQEGAPDGAIQATLLIEVGGRSAQRGWHAVTTLECSWRAQDTELRLSTAQVKAFETTELEIPGGQLFEDVTAAALADEPAWANQLLVGQDRWAKTIEERLGMGLYKHSGVAVGDANGDGREDIYVAQPAGLPNLLLLKDSSGKLTNAAKDAGVDWLDHTSSAVFADLDADGDLDLVATVAGTVLVHENVGPDPANITSPMTPRYLRRVALASGDTDLYGLSAADVDRDGDLDLYVTADFASRRDSGGEERARFDYVNANDGGRNVLWRNDGAFRFVDATKVLGLDEHNRRHSLAATWRDIDRDGDVDLYVANDYGQNCLYLNRSDLGQGRVGPLFKECAPECGVVDRGSGMSVDVGDPNRDGRPDLLVANMWSSAGRRIVPQSGFGAAASAEQREQFSRFAKGNTLFLGAPKGEPKADETRKLPVPFTEASTGSNIERGRWAWGSRLVDIDGDGWEDMLVGNGYVTSSNSGDL